MTVEQILENYTKLCTGLEPIGNIQMREYEELKYLAKCIDEKLISDDDVIKAFKRANKSNFLCGKKTSFRATISWMCNPAHLEKINNGAYDDRETQKKIKSHDYDFDELERKIAKANRKKLEKIRSKKC